MDLELPSVDACQVIMHSSFRDVHRNFEGPLLCPGKKGQHVHFCNRHRHAPWTHILPIILVSVISSLNMYSVFWAMRLGYSDINMSTGPGIFIKIKKVNGELINIGSCRGPPAMPSRTTRATDPWLKTPDVGYIAFLCGIV